jgi:predicted amino acid dehydrogenase
MLSSDVISTPNGDEQPRYSTKWTRVGDVIDLSREDFTRLEHWQPKYGVENYDRRRLVRKCIDVANCLRSRGVDSQIVDSDLKSTLYFLNRTFDYYEGKVSPGINGSFAFVVPSRLQRSRRDYGSEMFQHLPIMAHVDKATAQLALVGTCPWIVDVYGRDPNGRQGAMIFAPVFHDMSTDIVTPSGRPDRLGAISVSFGIVEDAVRFARDRLGVEVAGLGATLPLVVFMARDILKRQFAVPGVTPTTGHAGTVWLLGEVVRRAIADHDLSSYEHVAVVGAGNVGSASAEYLLETGIAGKVALCDVDSGRARRVGKGLVDRYGHNKVEVVDSVTEILKRRGVIVSAVTRPIRIDASVEDMSESVIIDDSQPHAVERSAVEAKSGKVAWVIGKDNSAGGCVTVQGGFEYGGWGPVSADELWGCQAEAAAISLQDAPDRAVLDRVTLREVTAMGEVCVESGITAAQLQSFGSYL